MDNGDDNKGDDATDYDDNNDDGVTDNDVGKDATAMV
jgi:hypothetical protein